jgi:integrase
MPKRTAVKLTPAMADRFRWKPDGAKTQRLWDLVVPGLGIDAQPSGRKSWVLRYKLGRERTIKLADMSSWSLDRAREEAIKAKDMVRGGEDPKAARDAPRKAGTVGEVWRSYKATAYFRSRSQDFQNGMESTMRVYVLPAWGHLPITSLRRRHVRDAVDALIEAGKEGAARGLLNRLRILMNFALERELIEASPADHIKPRYTGTGRRSQWLDTAEQLKAAWWLDAPLQVRGMVRWMLLTGCRRDEARLTERAWLTDAWRLPTTKNDRPLALPMMPAMEDIIKELRETFGPSTWLFPATTTARKPIPRASFDYCVRVATGGAWSAHVLRHSVESWLAELKVPEEGRDLILNHVRKGSGARYGHSERLDEKHDILRCWHARLLDIVDGT